MPKKRTESDLKREILKAANLIPGVFLFPTGVGSFVSEYKGRKRFIRMGMKGCSDLCGYRQRSVITENRGPDFREWSSGRVGLPIFVALEVKTETGRVRPEQQAFLDRVKADGGIAAVVRSVEDAIKVLS